jgi:PASTA domain
MEETENTPLQVTEPPLETCCPKCGRIFTQSDAKCSNCATENPNYVKPPAVPLRTRLTTLWIHLEPCRAFWARNHKVILKTTFVLALSGVLWFLHTRNPQILTTTLSNLKAIVANLQKQLQPTPTKPPTRKPKTVSKRQTSHYLNQQMQQNHAPVTPLFQGFQDSEEKVTVPSLVGHTLGEATEIAESHNLQLVEHRPRQVKEGFFEDEVFLQSLPVGKRVKPDSVIYVRVATGQTEEMQGDNSSDLPDEPNDTPDEPNDTPDEPNDTPDEPNDTPDEPNDTPDEPNDTPDESIEPSTKRTDTAKDSTSTVSPSTRQITPPPNIPTTQ